jgi:hypothetical protein
VRRTVEVDIHSVSKSAPAEVGCQRHAAVAIPPGKDPIRTEVGSACASGPRPQVFAKIYSNPDLKSGPSSQ